ncbi:MAG: hypothetical protein R6V56_07125 [Lentisphaeria bacterium]
MNKRILYAFLLIGILVIVLLFNSGDKTTVNLLFSKLKLMSSLIFLSFTAVGVIIGALIK